MNWNSGLKRLSAVFFGFWGLVFFGGFVSRMQKEFFPSLGMALAALIAAFVAHAITCWLVDGFTSNKPTLKSPENEQAH